MIKDELSNELNADGGEDHATESMAEIPTYNP